MAVSARISNYAEKEHQLHFIFAKLRKDSTELFSIPFEVAVRELVRDDEEGAEIDEAIIRYEFENNKPAFSGFVNICHNSIASQLMLALLITRVNELYSYITLTALSLITNLLKDDILKGLNQLESMRIIKFEKCGGKYLVKFMYKI